MSADPQLIDHYTIAALKEAALVAANYRSRICLHQSLDSKVQQMLIAFHAKSFIGPHRQVGREKSYVIMDGAATVAFFDEQGVLTEKVVLSDIKQSGPSLIHFTSSLWHIFVPQTEYVVYLETLEGPFNTELTEYAPWAPSYWDSNVIREFLKQYRIDCPF